MLLSENQKTFFEFFFCISGIYIKFEMLWEKRWASGVISFWNYRLQKVGLLKFPKSLVAEHFCRVNMLNGPKHCMNLHGSILFIFFVHFEKKTAPQDLF